MSTTKPITSGNFTSAQQISSLALSDYQFRKVDEQVNRLLRCRGIKPAAMTLIDKTGSDKTRYAIKKKERLSRYALSCGSHKAMPVLFVKAPKASAPKTLIERMLVELGDIKPSYGSVNQKEKRLTSLIEKREVQLIIIDEIQDFLSKTVTRSPSKATTWLKSLMDETATPILFMGTERTGLLHTIDKDLASRICFSAKLK